MDSGSKDTADRHEAEDRGADGLADRTVKKKKKKWSSCWIEREVGEGQAYIPASKELATEKRETYLQEWDVMRRDSRRGSSQWKWQHMASAVTGSQMLSCSMLLYNLLSWHAVKPQLPVELCSAGQEQQHVLYAGQKKNNPKSIVRLQF